jgi:hypothetical protein
MTEAPVDLGLAGKDVWNLMVAFQLTLTLLAGSGDRESWLTLQGGFEFRDGAESYELDPCYAPEGLGPVFRLRNRKVTRATATREGFLEVEFEGGATISAAPLPLAEAWEVGHAGGTRTVCLPGGGLHEYPAAD